MNRRRLRIRVALWLATLLLGAAVATHRRDADPAAALLLLILIVTTATIADRLFTREHRR